MTCRFPVGMAGFEPAASSSRSQVVMLTASASARLTSKSWSVDVRGCPPLAVAIVTHLPLLAQRVEIEARRGHGRLARPHETAGTD
jgi:hypothetical protein